MRSRLSGFIVFLLAAWLQAQEKPLILVVAPGRARPAYHLDSVDVSADPLRGLGLAIEKHGQNWPLTIAVDSRLSINTLWEAGALAGKAGFINVRYYAFHHDGRKMKEVSFGNNVSLPTE